MHQLHRSLISSESIPLQQGLKLVESGTWSCKETFENIPLQKGLGHSIATR